MTKLIPLSYNDMMAVTNLFDSRKRLVCEFHDKAGPLPNRITLNNTCLGLRTMPWNLSPCLVFWQLESRPYPFLRIVKCSEAESGQWIVTGIRADEGRPVLKLEQVA